MATKNPATTEAENATPVPVDKRTAALERIRDAQWGSSGECALTSLIREMQAIAAEALSA
jgi:hypothetical protein